MNGSDTFSQHYLLHEQYRNASNLKTRMAITRRLSVNQVDWYQWLFGLMKPASPCRILELGCGSGDLWLRNLGRIPAEWDITLSDFSPGMLKDTQTNLKASERHFSFQLIDAQSIPYPDAHFDHLIANLMLYHVPDRPRTLAEIRRVLKPEGSFYAATVSEAALAGLEQWVNDVGIATWADTSNFSLENGTEQLSRWFSHVSLQRMEDELVIDETDLLVKIIRTGTSKTEYSEETFQRLQDVIEQNLAQYGPLHLKVEIGLFEASR